MREIKFRRFNKLCKEMVTCLSNYDLENLFRVVNYRPEIYELMQYSGIKDKNGREIYEGDIVKGLGDNCYYEVEFFNGIFGTRIGAICTLELEVIGNKYENPELCEKI